MRVIITIALLSFGFVSLSQTATTFGGNAGASGYSNPSNTNEKWMKIGHMTLNGTWKRGSIFIDIYPKLSAHGDSRQTLIINMGSDGNGYLHSSNDIVLITQSGTSKAVKDIKVIHTSGGGASALNLSIWVQLGCSYAYGIPIEYRTYDNATYYEGNQPYSESITETGTVYSLTSTYGLYNDYFGIGTTSPSSELEIASKLGSDARLHLDAGTDGDQSIIRFQDAGTDTWGFLSNYPSAGKFSLYNYQLNSNAIVLDDQSNVGIGTTSPEEKLHVYGGNNAIHAKFNGSYSGPQGIQIRRDGGADIKVLANYTSFGGGIQSSSALRFSVNGNTLSDPALYLKTDGNIGIGTTTPTHKLEVNGTIRSKEVKVEASPWPDYVFEPDYNLLSLEEIEAFIQSEKHLPEIPSAKEMEANGVMLGEMNMMLLKKIEELTLHLIEVNKENVTLRQALKDNSDIQMNLQERLETLEKIILETRNESVDENK